MSDKGRHTLPWDLLRGACEGGGSAFINTFALLIAIEYFDCSTHEKSMIAAGSHWGLALSVFYATYAHALLGKLNVEAAAPMLCGAMFITLCGFAGGGSMFALLACLASLSLGLRSPLMTALYRENYSSTVRGQIFGIIVVVNAMFMVSFTWLGGALLDHSIGMFGWVAGLAGLFSLMGTLATLQIPAEKHLRQPLPNPFAYFIALKNREFGYVLITWFIFGLANLAMLPQRFEYVSNPEYGFELSPGEIALVIGVIPEAVRVLAVIPMGKLFDQINFITLRVVINMFFLVFQMVFFYAGSMPALCFGGVMLGIANAGGSVAWSLWVTRYAPPEETAKYMAVHTFLTGVRGIMAPYFGYWLAALGTVRLATWVTGMMMMVSSVILVFLELRGRKKGGLTDFEAVEDPE